MKRKFAYKVKVRVYVENPVLNMLVHIVLQSMRGVANIIDGLVLILSLGHFLPALGFRMVMFIIKQIKRDE
jgi:hypothetical protein|tara:strand:+ start:122 stop:334 length:213 start_codon:yes stop_codon:yes gene_type:complete